MSQYSDASSPPTLNEPLHQEGDGPGPSISHFKPPTSDTTTTDSSVRPIITSTRTTARDSSISSPPTPGVARNLRRKPPRLEFISDYTGPLNDVDDSVLRQSDNGWNYVGPQAQLPRHASAAAGLSTLSAGYSGTSFAPPLQRTPSIDRTGEQSGGTRRVPSLSEYSPGLDRSSLIGLGELATPRWTSTMLEQRKYQSMTGEHELRYDEGLPDPDMMVGPLFTFRDLVDPY